MSTQNEVFPIVKLENPEEIKDCFYKTGYFSSQSYDSQTNFEQIGQHVTYAGHGSAMRRVYFVFSIEGVSRVMTHQHTRHNTGVAHNQRSQRYCLEEGFNYVIPPKIKNNPQALDLFIQKMHSDNEYYQKLLSLGIPSEDARYALPNACESKVNSVFSLQALIHYCNERMCQRAGFEIRRVAQLIQQEVNKVNPDVAKLLVPKCSNLGYCPEGKTDCLYPPKNKVLEGYKKWLSVASDMDE